MFHSAIYVDQKPEKHNHILYADSLKQALTGYTPIWLALEHISLAPEPPSFLLLVVGESGDPNKKGKEIEQIWIVRKEIEQIWISLGGYLTLFAHTIQLCLQSLCFLISRHHIFHIRVNVMIPGYFTGCPRARYTYHNHLEPRISPGLRGSGVSLVNHVHIDSKAINDVPHYSVVINPGPSRVTPVTSGVCGGTVPSVPIRSISV